MSTPRELAETYFTAWQDEDWPRLRSILADDVTFAGPMGTTDGIDDAIRGLQGVRSMMTGLSISVVVADDTDVITWYELRTDTGVLQTANWSHVEDGRIAQIRATFDPRPITG